MCQAGSNGSYSLAYGSVYEYWDGTSSLMSTKQYWALIGLVTCKHSSKSPNWYLLPDNKPTACLADASHTETNNKMSLTLVFNVIETIYFQRKLLRALQVMET